MKDKSIKKPKRWWQVFRAKDEDEIDSIELLAPIPVPAAEPDNKAAEDKLAIKQTLSGIESQLDIVGEQNQMLLLTLGTLKENNKVLLQQIQTLNDTNKQLFDRIQASRKREKALKIVAGLSSVIALGLGVYNTITKIIIPLFFS